jgi:serine/threonine protein kinase
MNIYPDFTEHNYQVLRELGRNREGGRISYLAACKDTQQQVVIKQFRFAQESSWQGFKTYEREIQILQAINHPRIPQYLDSFETADGFCMVQEYQDAPALATKKSFSPQAIKQIIVSVLEILVNLQQRLPPIIHRDIKPENILVNENHQAYLIDFGLARIHNQELAMSSVIAGTPGFMPPEELFNRPLTKASDLYSVGATAIALITNTSSSNLSNLIDDNYQFRFKHLLTGINPDFIRWLQKMVAPNLKDRFCNAQAALTELESIDITGVSIVKSVKQPQNHLAIAIVGGTMLILLPSFFGLTPGFKSSPQPASVPSTAQQSTTSLTEEEQWFQGIKSRCNSVEVVIAMQDQSYPLTPTGVGYGASCYALAGRLDLADQAIQKLPLDSRPHAAGVVFNIGHPVADMGDDQSAGPIMDLVVRYWPENYMASYHAGMSAYILNDYPKAVSHLEDFLRIYQAQDGWTTKAKEALTRMEQGIAADESFSVHH